MKNISIISIGIILLLLSNYFGHVYPPFSINFTPILIGLFTGLILFLSNFNLIGKFGFIIGMIISNDILIKLFAGGQHDWEGAGWVSIFLFLGLIISLLLIVIYGFTEQKKRKKEHFYYLLVSSIILWGYLFLFDSLGMIWVNNQSENIVTSKSKGLFISNIRISDRIIKYGKDTFIIKSGWIEHQTKSNHMGIFKKTEKTDMQYCTFLIKGKFEHLNYDRNIYYEMKTPNSSGYQQLDSVITLILDKKVNKYRLAFYNNKFDKIKEVEILRKGR